MQLSEATANVLKNFSQINPSIQFKGWSGIKNGKSSKDCYGESYY